MLITKKMIKEKRKDFVSDCCVLRWETMRMWRRNLPITVLFSSSLHVGWVGSGGALGGVTVLSVCWVYGQHCAEFSHRAADVRESWFVADNYRWIYLDFLLRVVQFLHACWWKELEIGPWTLSFPSSCLRRVRGSGIESSVLHLCCTTAEGQHLL